MDRSGRAQPSDDDVPPPTERPPDSVNVVAAAIMVLMIGAAIFLALLFGPFDRLWSSAPWRKDLFAKPPVHAPLPDPHRHVSQS